MTDPEVGRLTFVGVVGPDPTPEEMAALMAKRITHLPRAVAESQGYRMLDPQTILVVGDTPKDIDAAKATVG